MATNEVQTLVFADGVAVTDPTAGIETASMFDLAEQSATPAHPASGYQRLYVKTDHAVYLERSDSTIQEVCVHGVSGTRASPTLITAVGGITPVGYFHETAFVAGNAAPIDVTVNPQIAAGTRVGQRLTIIGRHDTNTLTLQDSNGLDLNGYIVLNTKAVLDLVWDGSNWLETSRKEL